MILIWLGLAHAADVQGVVKTFGRGEPVENAIVQYIMQPATATPTLLGPADSEISQVTTDARGRFTITTPSDNGQNGLLIVRADGYAPWTGEWTGQRSIRVYVEPAPQPLEVVVESLRPSSHLSRHTVDQEQLQTTPGNYDDAVRLLQGMPGVAVQREFSPTAGDVAVRGSTPGQNRYLVDGVEVPYLYHFNQYASVLPSQQLQRLELYPSTFGVKYGDAVGGVIEAYTDNEPPTGVHGDAQLNFLTLGASVRAPISNNWWFSASGRRSYQDIAGEQSAQYTVWPVFQDYALRLQHHTATTTTSLYSWGAGDGYTRAAGELDLLDPLEAQQTAQFTYQEHFGVHGLSHQWSNGSSTGRLVNAVVQYNRAGDMNNGSFEDLQTLTATSRGDVVARAGQHGEVSAGWELRSGQTKLAANGTNIDGLLVGSESPSIARARAVDTTRTRHQFGAYTGAQIWLGSVIALPGFRLDADTLAATVQAQPRLTIRWEATEQTHLKASAGIYSQEPATAERIFDATLPTTHSQQLGLGIEQTIASRLEIQVDSYYNALEDALISPPVGPLQLAPRGRAFGLELVTRYRIRDAFFVWAWMTFSRSQWEQNDTWFSSPADQPIAGGLVTSWKVNKRWTLGLRYRAASGLPFTPVSDAIYSATNDSWIPIPGSLNSGRFPVYHRLDTRAATTWTFR